MKISYIIAPFRSSEYLVRCINSILRQTLSDNEIIIAENSFELSEEIKACLSSKEQIKRISDKPQTELEKIAEAVEAAQENTLIKFMNVNTVAVPIASAEAEKCESDVVFTAAAVKNNEDYDVKKPDAYMTLQNAFIKKEMLATMPEEAFADPFLFELWMDRNLSEEIKYSSTDEICFYIQEQSAADTGTPQQLINAKDELLVIFENSLKNSGTKEGLALFDKYLSALCRLMNNESCDDKTKAEAFEIVKETARLVGDNDLAQRMFLLYFGVSAEAAAGMDAEAYMFYSGRVLALSDQSIVVARLEQIVENSTQPIRNSLSLITEIKSKQNDEAKKNKAMSDEINKLKNDIAALTKNMHFVFNSASAGGETEVFTEPLQQIPALFAQGKLGLKVIIKSFKAWLKYKLRIRKK